MGNATASMSTLEAAILEDRWLLATTKPTQFGDGSISWGNSRAVERIYDAVEALAARLVEDLNADDRDRLAQIASEALNDSIKPAIFALALAIAERRAEHERDRGMTAPTRDEIREAIRRRMVDLPGDNPAAKITDGIGSMGDFLYGPWAATLDPDSVLGPDDPDPSDESHAVWRDLRRTEARALRDLYEDAVDRATARCIEAATEELVAAGLAFAERFPDAPRVRVLDGFDGMPDA